jgi:predicted small metal-binding protein
VALTGFNCADEAATGAACGWAAWADEKLELSRAIDTAKRTHDTAAMVRIDERRKQSSEKRLIAMLIGERWSR